MKKIIIGSKRIVCLLLALLLTASLLPMAAFAADVQYKIGFVDQDGNRIYGSVSIQNAYDGTRYFTTSSYTPYITFTATSSRYYNVTFQNNDGYYRFYTFLASTDDTAKDKSAVSCMALRVPYTVTVRYADGTLATGVKVRADYEVGEQTTNGSGQCTVYGAVNRDVTVEAFDGQNWVGTVIRPATPGPKTLELTIEKRVAVPIKVLLGGQEFNGFTVTASNAEETVSGNPPYLKPNKTYTLQIAHHEQGDNILEYQLENGIHPITATYTVPKTPTAQTFHATLKPPVPYYFGYVGSTPQFIYAENGKTYTLSSGRSISFLIENRIKGATYTLTSSNPAAVSVNALSYTTVAAGEATLTLTVTYGTASESIRFTVKVPRTQIAIPAADPTVYTYDGTEHTYQIPANNAYTVSNATRTEAGSQQVTVSLKDTARTEWSDGTTSDKRYTFTVQQAASVTTHPSGLNLSYNGTPQTLIAPGVAVDSAFAFEYALGTDNSTPPAAGWSTALPTATDAGDYYVWYRLNADSNHKSVAPSCTLAEILPISPTADLFLFAPPTMLTYDGAPKLADVTPAPSVHGMGAVTVRYYDENGQPIDAPIEAGSYRIELEVANGTNYTAATLQNENWTFTVASRQLTVQWGETSFVYDGSEHFPTLLVSGIVGADDVLLLTEGAQINANPIGSPYTAKIIGISGNDSANYTLPADCDTTFTIAKRDPDVGTVTVVGTVTDRTLPKYVELQHSGSAQGTLAIADIAMLADKSGYTWRFTPADTVNYNTLHGAVSIDVLDTTAPTATVTVAENTWSKLLSNVTFGLFFAEAQTATVTAADDVNGSGLKEVLYCLADRPMTAEELAVAEWTPYTAPLTLATDGEWVIYCKVTDADGNETVISSDGLVLDQIAPLLKDLNDQATYYGDLTLRVEEPYLSSLTVDGNDLTDQLTDGTLTLPADNAEHTVIATDKAGNVTTRTVTLYKLYTVTFEDENGVVQTVTVKHGETVPMPEPPKKEGYTVTWETVLDTVSGDTTVRAVYTKKPAGAPATGDSSNATLWVALAIISGGLLATMTLFKKRIK